MPDDKKSKPILLPPKHEFTRLIIREAHELVHHDRIRETLNCVRRKYCVLRGRESVTRMVRMAMACNSMTTANTTFNSSGAEIESRYRERRACRQLLKVHQKKKNRPDSHRDELQRYLVNFYERR
ncbi:Hypothetical predicted protein [Paramuricea clavata]|uniref:Integrase zinc-binding domain-containing protein n=1 Tax=Paramuricea clavata TaxID=317549 RepID=A0A7D9HDD6_PARCT|nr:Hypothetical predicted protein [Paramuricea clavata]